MRRSSGFTLIELMTVVVILAVIGTLGSGYLVSAVQSYRISSERAKLIAQGRQALERMSRELRQALPNSVRVTGAGNCVEFLPLVAGGNYIGVLPDSSNGAGGVSSFETGGYQLGPGKARYVYVGALAVADVYGGDSGAAISAAEDHSDNILSLSAAHQFTRNSVRRRFFLADNPAAFCFSAAEIRHYADYATPTSSSGSPSGAGTLLAAGVSLSGGPFSLSAGTEDRNSVLSMAFNFSRSGETVTLSQQVFIRNVP